MDDDKMGADYSDDEDAIKSKQNKKKFYNSNISDILTIIQETHST